MLVNPSLYHLYPRVLAPLETRTKLSPNANYVSVAAATVHRCWVQAASALRKVRLGCEKRVWQPEALQEMAYVYPTVRSIKSFGQLLSRKVRARC